MNPITGMRIPLITSVNRGVRQGEAEEGDKQAEENEKEAEEKQLYIYRSTYAGIYVPRYLSNF